MLRQEIKSDPAWRLDDATGLEKRFLASLPFKLTAAQARALAEVDSDLSEDEMTERAKADFAPYFPEANFDSWRLLRVYHNRQAQFAQPVGIWNKLPLTQTATPGLLLAGEITVSSSLHGALVAGRRAAQAVMAEA